MLRNNNGYLLLDSIFAGLVLVFLCMAVIPLITHIYLKRLDLVYEETALDQLKMAVVSYEKSGKIITPMISIGGQSYSINERVATNGKSICVSWNSIKKHPFEKCVNIYVEEK